MPGLPDREPVPVEIPIEKRRSLIVCILLFVTQRSVRRMALLFKLAYIRFRASVGSPGVSTRQTQNTTTIGDT